MARTNKQEAERVKKFTAEATALIEAQGRNVEDFDFEQGSDKLEELVAHLNSVGGSNAADTKTEAPDSKTKVVEAQSESESGETAQDIEESARARAGEVIAAAEERAKVIIAEASHHAQRIINEAQDKAGTQDDVADVVAVDPADLKEYRNTGKKNLFTEAGRCLPDGTVRLTAEEAESYSDLEELGEDLDPADEVEEPA